MRKTFYTQKQGFHQPFTA